MSKSKNEKLTIGIRVSKEEKDCIEGLAKAKNSTITDILRSAVKRIYDETRTPSSTPAVLQTDDSVKAMLQEILAAVKCTTPTTQEHAAPVHIEVEPMDVEAFAGAIADATSENTTGFSDPIEGIGRHEKNGIFVAEIPFTITANDHARNAIQGLRDRATTKVFGNTRVFHDANSKGGKSWFFNCENSETREKMLQEFFANAGFLTTKVNG